MSEPTKLCSICGKSRPLLAFSYGNRHNRSYCLECNKADQAAYAKGGREAALAFREEMRRKWKQWAVSSLKCNAGDLIEFDLIEDFLRRSEVEDLARRVVHDVLDAAQILVGEW